ncbi:hypothetical protein ACFB49_30490 [Sphingomonas sp. DBB INV C78]|uniref:hypothetical protein n=1 Tax=Sphingomonas sp. DBB INV C78 TaxID=3349434 RepID=UPI0036D32F7A
MANALSNLLKTETVTRNVQAYEDVFDDYIVFAGGQRVAAVAEIPQAALNADYVLEAAEAQLVIELKQVSKYQASNTLDEYFSDLLRRGRIHNPNFTGPGQLRLDPASLSVNDWTRFYRKFRPRIPEALDKAAKQIKATARLLPNTKERFVGVAVLLNTGDYNLPVDLMFRIAERHANAKWKAGRFSALDAILCLSMDMVKTGQHPLRGHAIVRDAADTVIAGSARYLYDRWVHYGAAAVGAEVEFTPGEVTPDALDLSGGIAGKMRWTPAISAIANSADA